MHDGLRREGETARSLRKIQKPFLLLCDPLSRKKERNTLKIMEAKVEIAKLLWITVHTRDYQQFIISCFIYIYIYRIDTSTRIKRHL